MYSVARNFLDVTLEILICLDELILFSIFFIFQEAHAETISRFELPAKWVNSPRSRYDLIYIFAVPLYISPSVRPRRLHAVRENEDGPGRPEKFLNNQALFASALLS